MLETVFAVLGALLGLGLVGILILIGAVVILLFILKGIIALIKFLVGSVPKKRKGVDIDD